MRYYKTLLLFSILFLMSYFVILYAFGMDTLTIYTIVLNPYELDLDFIVTYLTKIDSRNPETYCISAHNGGPR